MFELNFSPVRSDSIAPLVVEKQGASLVVCGDVLDFSSMPTDSRLPLEGVDNDYIVSDITKSAEGVVTLTLMLPHGMNPPAAMAFPQPIAVTEDGPVILPAIPEEAAEDAS